MHVHRRELEHRADHHRHLRVVVPDLVDGRAQGHVAARAGRAHRVDGAARLQDFRDAAGVIRDVETPMHNDCTRSGATER